MILGLVLVAAAFALRSATSNHHIRGRLLASAIAFGGYVTLQAGFDYQWLDATVQQQAGALAPLLLTFGLLNAFVALAINPWRADRLPDRFPTIVQDTIVIALFAVAATLILQERILATSAVGAVVIGFALQDTLGNLFAGLAIQIEKPFRVGHWVQIAGKDGLVSQITWRATKMRTKVGNFVVVPNSVLARDTITNYSEPTPDTIIEIDVGASYDVPPNTVKDTILAAIQHLPLLSPARPPEVLLRDFAASAVTYRIRVWTTDFGADDRIRDQVLASVYYAFRRTAIEIPYPIQVEISREAGGPAQDTPAIQEVLRAVSVFAALTDEARADLARAVRPALYAAGEMIVRQGAPGRSMFVVVRGEVTITIEPSGTEVARTGPGGFFGEMSLLTGAVRSATVTALNDCEVLEITADAFRAFVMANPACADQIGLAVAGRAAELDERREGASRQLSSADPPDTFLARMRRFLNLSFP